MFQRLYELSHVLPEVEEWQRLNEGMPEVYDRGLAVCFDEQGKFVSVDGVTGNKGVVYRAGPPNGTDLTPCCKLAADTNKTADRLFRAAANLMESEFVSPAEQDWLEKTVAQFNQGKRAVVDEILQAIQGSAIDGKTHRGYLFLARKAEGFISAIYDWPPSRQFLVWKSGEDLGTHRCNGTCFVCGKVRERVYGNFSVLKCYSLDKQGNIAGGFNKALAHKNFPVCGHCALAMAEAISYAEKNLSSSMAGQSYMVLPYANAETVREELYHALRVHPDRFRLKSQTDLIREEWKLLKDFSGTGDQIAFYLIFFKTGKADWRIQAEVQQLLPSRMKELYEALKQLREARDLGTEKDGEYIPFEMGAQILRRFSGASEQESSDTLRAWLVALFEKREIDYGQFLHHLVAKTLTASRKNPDYLRSTTRQAWALYRYAALTGLIHPPTIRGDTMNEAIPASAYGRYVEEHSEFFNSAEKVAAFLTGCYVSTVMYVQKNERGAAPFGKKFIGRLTNRKLLRRLYREGHAKLAQYDKLGFVMGGLDPDLANAWVTCGDRWEIDDEESTFAFTLGYSLANRIRRLSSDPGEETEDETNTDEEV